MSESFVTNKRHKFILVEPLQSLPTLSASKRRSILRPCVNPPGNGGIVKILISHSEPDLFESFF